MSEEYETAPNGLRLRCDVCGGYMWHCDAACMNTQEVMSPDDWDDCYRIPTDEEIQYELDYWRGKSNL